MRNQTIPFPIETSRSRNDALPFKRIRMGRWSGLLTAIGGFPYWTHDIGRTKADSALEKLHRLNPARHIAPFHDEI
jgi:hypothetical protein